MSSHFPPFFILNCTVSLLICRYFHILTTESLSLYIVTISSTIFLNCCISVVWNNLFSCAILYMHVCSLNIFTHITFTVNFYYFCISFVYACVGMCGCQSFCEAKKTTFRIWFSPSALWVLRFKLRSTALSVGVFAHWPLLSFLGPTLWCVHSLP